MSIIKKYKAIQISGLALFIMLIGATSLHAQRQPKYENVYKAAMAANNNAFAYSFFSEYLKQNATSTRANLYFQLGISAYELAKTVDPIAQHADYTAYSNDADKYLNSCLTYLNEQEVKRDDDMYQGVQPSAKKITYTDVSNYISKIITENKEYSQSISKIYNAYTKLTWNYANCRNHYIKLCQTYTYRSVKDMYLLTDNQLTDWLTKITVLYDSAMFYKNEYKNLLSKYPVKGYTYSEPTIKPIHIFRVDGIGESYFHTASPLVWDYKTWAQNILQNMDNFSRLYQEITNNEAELKKKINWFNSNRALSDTYIGYEIDDTMLDSLNMYGYYPSLNSLIAYKEEKLNFLTISRRKINSPEYDDNSKLSMADKVHYYNKLQTAYANLEQLRKALETYTTSDNQADYKVIDFQTKDDFKEYLKDESIENQLEIRNAVENIQKYFIKAENSMHKIRYTTYKKHDIPLFLGTGFYQSATLQSYITKCIAPANSGTYIAGSYIGREGVVNAYIALCTPDTSNSVVWLKTIDIGGTTYDNCTMAISPLADGGCFMVVVAKSVTDPDLLYNTLIRLDAKGRETKRITLPEKTLGMVRYMRYDEINGRILLVYYGNNETWYEPDGRLVVQEIDMNNNQLMRAEFKLNGEFIDIVDVKSGYMIIGNYTSITDEKGVEYQKKDISGVRQSDIFSALLSREGKLTNVNRYSVRKSGYAIKAVKLAANSINIIGQKGLPRKNPVAKLEAGELIFIEIDDNGIQQNNSMQ